MGVDYTRNPALSKSCSTMAAHSSRWAVDLLVGAGAARSIHTINARREESSKGGKKNESCAAPFETADKSIFF